MLGLTKDEHSALRSLTTPIKIQNYLDTLPINWEKRGDTCMSPRRVLRERKAHCFEGALLAATALLLQGKTPWIMDLKTSEGDDHVIALYKLNGYWGAISKTNHPTLRYRDPVYGTLHELALSYFHEYFNNRTGKKILESYSKPFNLNKFGTRWITSEADLHPIAEALDASLHYELVPSENKKYIRNADAVEMLSGNIIEWRQSDPRT